MGWKAVLTLVLVAGLGTGASRIDATQDRNQPTKPKTRADIPKITDESHPVRVALEKNYAQIAQAYYDGDPGPIAALRAPNFCWRSPDGRRATAQAAADYLHAGFDQVVRTIYVSFTVDSLVVDGESALVWMRRQWRRKQQTGDAVHLVETEAEQCEWWRNTKDGWRMFFVDDIHPGVWKIDGEHIDPSRSYDPEAVPYDP